MREKHLELGDPEGLNHLKYASLLDPRFKCMPETFMNSPDEVDRSRVSLQAHLVKRSEAYSHLPLADAAVAVAAEEVDPLQQPLACLVPPKKKR